MGRYAILAHPQLKPIKIYGFNNAFCPPHKIVLGLKRVTYLRPPTHIFYHLAPTPTHTMLVCGLYRLPT